MPVGDVLLGCEGEDELTVTGWTQSTSLARVSKKSALNELRDVKGIYGEIIKACPSLLALAGKKKVWFCLGFDYGMGAIRICTEMNGEIYWEYNPEH